jgi:predicted transcriptional regulator of viral defense system
LCMNGSTKRPDWNLLYETVSAQEGYFTTRQAAGLGFSSQLLRKHIRAGRVMRVHRGIYRLVHFPAEEQEELVIAWLWSDGVGVVSHQSALSLLGLSDVLPEQVHLILPRAWQNRRFRVPEGVVLHHADVPLDDRTWFGAVPINNPRRTLSDCAQVGIPPDLLRQSVRQALRRGLVAWVALADV